MVLEEALALFIWDDGSGGGYIDYGEDDGKEWRSG
jgi:hypothetical protein